MKLKAFEEDMIDRWHQLQGQTMEMFQADECNPDIVRWTIPHLTLKPIELRYKNLIIL